MVIMLFLDALLPPFLSGVAGHHTWQGKWIRRGLYQLDVSISNVPYLSECLMLHRKRHDRRRSPLLPVSSYMQSGLIGSQEYVSPPSVPLTSRQALLPP